MGAAERRAALAEGGGDLDGGRGDRDAAQASRGVAGSVRRLARRRSQSSHQESARSDREALHRVHRLRVARVDMGQRERHHGRRDPGRLPRREAGPGVGPSAKEAIAVSREVHHQRGRPGLAVVLFPRRDHAVPGRRHPVRHSGTLAQHGGHHIEMRSEGFGGIEDAEGAGSAGEPLREPAGDRAPVPAEADRGREGFAGAGHGQTLRTGGDERGWGGLAGRADPPRAMRRTRAGHSRRRGHPWPEDIFACGMRHEIT